MTAKDRNALTPKEAQVPLTREQIEQERAVEVMNRNYFDEQASLHKTNGYWALAREGADRRIALCDMALQSLDARERALDYVRLRGLIERRIQGMAMPVDPGPEQECAKCAHSELSDLLAAFDAGEALATTKTTDGVEDCEPYHREPYKTLLKTTDGLAASKETP